MRYVDAGSMSAPTARVRAVVRVPGVVACDRRPAHERSQGLTFGRRPASVALPRICSPIHVTYSDFTPSSLDFKKPHRQSRDDCVSITGALDALLAQCKRPMHLDFCHFPYFAAASSESVISPELTLVIAHPTEVTARWLLAERTLDFRGISDQRMPIIVPPIFMIESREKFVVNCPGQRSS